MAEESDQEKRLWVSVVTQAIVDATSSKSITVKSAKSRRRERTAIRDLARGWLLSRSVDFDMVCELADLNPDMVRDKAIELIKKDDLEHPLPAKKQLSFW